MLKTIFIFRTWTPNVCTYYTVETFKHTTDEKLYRETKRDREQTRIIAATSQQLRIYLVLLTQHTHTYSNLEDILKR